jgi:hypothetical protein
MSHRTCSYIYTYIKLRVLYIYIYIYIYNMYVYIHSVANSVLLHDFYDTDFKIKHKLYTASSSVNSPPPRVWVRIFADTNKQVVCRIIKTNVSDGSISTTTYFQITSNAMKEDRAKPFRHNCSYFVFQFVPPNCRSISTSSSNSVTANTPVLPHRHVFSR